MPNRIDTITKSSLVQVPEWMNITSQVVRVVNPIAKGFGYVAGALFVAWAIAWLIHGFNLKDPLVSNLGHAWLVVAVTVFVYQVAVAIYAIWLFTVKLPAFYAQYIQNRIKQENNIDLTDADAKKIVSATVRDVSEAKKDPNYVAPYTTLENNPGIKVRWISKGNKLDISGQTGNRPGDVIPHTEVGADILQPGSNASFTPTKLMKNPDLEPDITTVTPEPVGVSPSNIRETPASQPVERVQEKLRLIAEKINPEAGKMLLDITQERMTERGVEPARIKKDYEWNAYLFGLAPNDEGRTRSRSDEKTILELLDNEVNALILEDVPANEAKDWRAQMVQALNEN